MPLLGLLLAAALGLFFASTILFYAPPKKAKTLSRTTGQTEYSSDIKYRKTVGF